MKTEAQKISLKSARKGRSWDSQILTTDTHLTLCGLETYQTPRSLGYRQLPGHGSLFLLC